MNKFNVGDVVEWAPGSPGDLGPTAMAAYGDYPGQVEEINPDGTYVVIFDPNVLPMRLRHIPEKWIQPRRGREEFDNTIRLQNPPRPINIRD